MQRQWTKQRMIWLLLVVLWMGVIFFFSSQNGEESSNLSGGITEFFAHLFHPNFEELSEMEQQKLLGQFSYLIRKGAHFSEYAILGMLLTGWSRTFKWNKWIQGGVCWGIGTLYAMSDEFHQMFSDGRSPQIFDVCIDSSGVLFGILAMGVVYAIMTLICQHNKARKI